MFFYNLISPLLHYISRNPSGYFCAYIFNINFHTSFSNADSLIQNKSYYRKFFIILYIEQFFIIEEPFCFPI